MWPFGKSRHQREVEDALSIISGGVASLRVGFEIQNVILERIEKQQGRLATDVVAGAGKQLERLEHIGKMLAGINRGELSVIFKSLEGLASLADKLYESGRPMLAALEAINGRQVSVRELVENVRMLVVKLEAKAATGEDVSRVGKALSALPQQFPKPPPPPPPPPPPDISVLLEALAEIGGKLDAHTSKFPEALAGVDGHALFDVQTHEGTGKVLAVRLHGCKWLGSDGKPPLKIETRPMSFSEAAAMRTGI